jgi:hypothetical protein
MKMKKKERMKMKKTMIMTKMKAMEHTMKATAETEGLRGMEVTKKVESRTNKMLMKVAWMKMRKETR